MDPTTSHGDGKLEDKQLNGGERKESDASEGKKQKSEEVEIDVHVQESLYKEVTSWINRVSAKEQKKPKREKVKVKKKVDNISHDIRKWLKKETPVNNVESTLQDTREVKGKTNNKTTFDRKEVGNVNEEIDKDQEKSRERQDRKARVDEKEEPLFREETGDTREVTRKVRELSVNEKEAPLCREENEDTREVIRKEREVRVNDKEKHLLREEKGDTRRVTRKDKELRDSDEEEPFNGEINGDTREVIRNYGKASLSDNEKQRVREDFADTREVQYTEGRDKNEKPISRDDDEVTRAGTKKIKELRDIDMRSRKMEDGGDVAEVMENKEERGYVNGKSIGREEGGDIREVINREVRVNNESSGRKDVCDSRKVIRVEKPSTRRIQGNGENNGSIVNYSEKRIGEKEVTSVIEDITDSKQRRENDLYEKGRKVDVDKGPPEEVLVDNGTRGLRLRRRDLQTLSGKNLLNDKILNQYVELIKKRNEADSSLPSIYSFNTFVYEVLDRLGLEEGEIKMKNWFQEDLREKDLIICPINKSLHWSMIIIEMQKKSIHYFDSLRGSRRASAAPKMMKRFIENYVKKKGEEATFRIKIRQDTPVQTNGVDCGVFALQCAERISRKCHLDFNQRDMDRMRVDMIREILEGRLDSHKEKSEHDKDGSHEGNAGKVPGSTTNKMGSKVKQGKKDGETHGSAKTRPYVKQGNKKGFETPRSTKTNNKIQPGVEKDGEASGSTRTKTSSKIHQEVKKDREPKQNKNQETGSKRNKDEKKERIDWPQASKQ